MPGGDYSRVRSGIPHAAKTPLRDLNLGIAPMPYQLETLQNPYGTDTHISCAVILREAQDLKTALRRNQTILSGPRIERGTRAGYLTRATTQTVRTATTTFIPFRGEIQYLSGAKRRIREAEEADRRGRERLGFLIGVGSANNCPGFGVRGRRMR